jgi:hypothetical protein
LDGYFNLKIFIHEKLRDPFEAKNYEMIQKFVFAVISDTISGREEGMVAVCGAKE